MPAAIGDFERVRLLLVTNEGGGFQLTASQPLPPVPPGGEYVTECWPQAPVSIREVIVESFTLVQISAGTRTVACESQDQDLRRLYLLTPSLAASADECVRIHLRNDTDAPLPPKNPVLIKDTVKTFQALMGILPNAVVLGQPTQIPQPVRVDVSPGPSIEHVANIEIENRCGICGESFQISSPDDPHTALINRTIKNAGRGPICPKETASTGRPEDAVACPACDKPPGDSCDGQTSHPARRKRYHNHNWSDWDRAELDKELTPWPTAKTSVKTYRCKHVVEAMQWKDTDDNREAFAAWFVKHGAMFETRGPEVVLPEEGTVVEGEWILFSDDEFIAMDDEMFRDTYVEAT